MHPECMDHTAYTPNECNTQSGEDDQTDAYLSPSLVHLVPQVFYLLLFADIGGYNKQVRLIDVVRDFLRSLLQPCLVNVGDRDLQTKPTMFRSLVSMT